MTALIKPVSVGSEAIHAANARSRADNVSGCSEPCGEKPSTNFVAFASWLFIQAASFAFSGSILCFILEVACFRLSKRATFRAPNPLPGLSFGLISNPGSVAVSPRMRDSVSDKPGTDRLSPVFSILHRPSLVIADEPTSALDAVTQSEILALFAELNRKLE
jgi:hypothetical protein